MRRTSFFLVFISLFFFVNAQIIEPIKWKFSTSDISESEKELVFKASIEKGWHLYGTELPEGGPIATEFIFENEIGRAHV